MSKQNHYGEKLRELITEHDINQVELAREYGCKADNVQKAMKSKTMKDDTFDKWVKAIEILIERKKNQRLQDKLDRIKAILEE